ncbi:diaminopimelate decarboxylase [Candidatus Woesearchaeota archaeon]|nr:diaminopimelate decarboxylase [Candidatus Woesearchaeota archaeon]
MTDIFNVLSADQARQIKEVFGTPTYVYSQRALEKNARETLAFPHAFGLTVRYAMKALPNAAILQLFQNQGLHIDASSGYEVERALQARIHPTKIQLTAQELPPQLPGYILRGVRFNACSLHQLETIGKIAPGSEISVRINPGKGSGANGKVNVGGFASSFGIWHELIPEVKEIAQTYDLRITRLHTHIGSGTDPHVWQQVALTSLDIVLQFPEVTTLNLGGGFKVARVPEEKATNLQECGRPIQRALIDFYHKKARRLHLEIEPGTYLVANAGVVVSSINDIVSTDRYTFLKVDSGMTEVTRPILYAAQHPIAIVSRDPETDLESRAEREYVVVGHCCESGDLWTPAQGNAEQIQTRLLPEAEIGDILILGGAGAYCSAMSTKNYNSFPEAAEVLITNNGSLELIRERQRLEEVTKKEIRILV